MPSHLLSVNVMKACIQIALLAPLVLASSLCLGQTLHSNVPYSHPGHARQVFDIYTPESNLNELLPVIFWIHGGGWVVGDKSDVGLKPKALTERGYIFVSTNYRLLPEVTMDELIGDIARSFATLHQIIENYGGNPKHIIVGGHSAGAQLAAILCTDHRYLEKHNIPLDVIKGCIPVDGDTYDIPKIIMTAEYRQALYGGKMFTFGHRQKFGNDPEKHVEFSAVTHVEPDKGIPPFLLLYFTGNPDTRAQAQRLHQVLQAAGISSRTFGKRDSNHRQLNNDLGDPTDDATKELFKFLEKVTP